MAGRGIHGEERTSVRPPAQPRRAVKVLAIQDERRLREISVGPVKALEHGQSVRWIEPENRSATVPNITAQIAAERSRSIQIACRIPNQPSGRIRSVCRRCGGSCRELMQDGFVSTRIQLENNPAA